MENLRHAFALSADDTEYLDNAFPGRWEAIAGNYILIHGFQTRPGYTENSVTAAIQIPCNYPAVQLDMVYFYPAVLRGDGQTIPATGCNEPIDGKSFQRWSRHYQSWNPEENNLATHVLAIGDWLDKGLAGQVPA